MADLRYLGGHGPYAGRDKLEAHSGIGKMADNPRFVHVKMNGPTPPNTYKLSMRETRFHGVEAIRMTPVGGGKMHGRDGILAHSYLLRGGRAELHGCVAFKDYPRFLKAFKQGKVKQLVVRAEPVEGAAATRRLEWQRRMPSARRLALSPPHPELVEGAGEKAISTS